MHRASCHTPRHRSAPDGADVVTAERTGHIHPCYGGASTAPGWLQVASRLAARPGLAAMPPESGPLATRAPLVARRLAAGQARRRRVGQPPWGAPFLCIPLPRAVPRLQIITGCKARPRCVLLTSLLAHSAASGAGSAHARAAPRAPTLPSSHYVRGHLDALGSQPVRHDLTTKQPSARPRTSAPSPSCLAIADGANLPRNQRRPATGDCISPRSRCAPVKARSVRLRCTPCGSVQKSRSCDRSIDSQTREA
jgi:hypothetical protein